tara:strand:+ start:1381 stop:1707 length:327 start_codon:yes stop_codon:yes gene_type:complete
MEGAVASILIFIIPLFVSLLAPDSEQFTYQGKLYPSVKVALAVITVAVLFRTVVFTPVATSLTKTSQVIFVTLFVLTGVKVKTVDVMFVHVSLDGLAGVKAAIEASTK